MKFTKQTLKRTLRTFCQAAVGYLLANLICVDFASGKEAVKSALIGLIVSALAAGVAALMNLEPSEMGGGTLTFDEFVKKFIGKATDFDGTSGVQCVDLAKMFIKYVLGIQPESIGNAHAYYDNFDKTYLKKHFKKIPYKKGIKSQKGDIVVWGQKYNGTSKYGHIAIATGKQDDNYIYTYDQNYGGKAMKECKHKINQIAGLLRPNDQSNINPPEKKKKSAYTVGKDYKLLENLNVRTAPSIDAKRKKYSELTENGKKHALPSEFAIFKRGTIVTCQDVKPEGKNTWIECPSGWLCAIKGNKTYIK